MRVKKSSSPSLVTEHATVLVLIQCDLTLTDKRVDGEEDLILKVIIVIS